MITCALVNSKGSSVAVAATAVAVAPSGNMVRSEANDDSNQVHRAGDREDDSTSSTADDSAPSSPFAQNFQQQSQRSAPCRLFIASADQLQQPRCVICGFHELDHLVRVLRRRPPQPLDANGQHHSGSRDRPVGENSSPNAVTPRHCCSDWNVFENGGASDAGTKTDAVASSVGSEWRNSYDVRGEYLSKEDFRAKYSEFFKSFPSENGRSSAKTEGGNHRKFYYHHPPTSSSVYYYTDRGRINDSGADTDVEQKPPKSGPISAYWSDSEAVKQSTIAAGDPFPLITFRPPPTAAAKTQQQQQQQRQRHSASFALSLTNPLASLLPAESEPKTSTPMFGQQKEAPEIPLRRSAFVDYKPTFNAKAASTDNHEGEKKPKKKTLAAVSFRQQTAVIGHDGGVEHFFYADSSDGSTVGDENGNHENVDDIEDRVDLNWAMEPKTEFEKTTEINTEFNSNRKNFIADEETKEKSESAVLVSVTVRPPPTPTTTSVSNSCSMPSEDRVSIEVGIREPSPPSKTASLNIDHQPSTEIVTTSPLNNNNRESTPMYAPIRKSIRPTETEPMSGPYTVRKSAKPNSELDQKLQRMARDLDACRLGGGAPVSKVKAPAPPPPIIVSTSNPISNNRVGGMLKKSYSAFVVPTPSPGLNASSIDLMSTSVNGIRHKGTGGELEIALDRSLSQDRCSSIDVSSPNASDDSSALAKAANRQSRSRFASIRKFLRISEPNHTALNGSVRRHHDSSSTNCSTISCSSSSNGSISFGNHGGFHSSLRKFPLLPFVMNGSKNRGDLNTVRGLFHGANECRAVDEIAQDTDVVVTEINELPSTNNTLVRASKRACTFGVSSPQISNDQGQTRKGEATNGYEHSCLNGTTNEAKRDDEASFDSASVYINRLDINGHEAQIPAPASLVTRQPATTLPPRPPPLTAVISTSHAAKVKRAAPGVPTVSGENASPPREKVTEITSPNSDDKKTTIESADKGTETAVWRLATTVAVQTTPDHNPQSKSTTPMPVSSATSRCQSAQPTGPETPRRDDRYDQLVAGHLSALSHLVEHFPSTTRQCRRKLTNLGVDSAKLKWSDFNVVANTPLLVTETSALYAGVLKLDNKPETQSLKVDLMITPLRYNNPIPTSTNQHRSFFPPVVAEFQEYIPSKLIKLNENDEEDDSGSESNRGRDENENGPRPQSTLCKILILPRMMVSNIESYADHTSSRHRPQKQPCLHEKEVCFIMIQLVSALKYLQSKGVEEINADLDGFLLFRTMAGRYPQLVLCCESFSTDHSPPTRPSDKNEDKANNRRLRITLCQGALAALCQLLHTEIPTEELIRERHAPVFAHLSTYSDGFQKAGDVLHAEKPHSLTHAKSLFEYMFWVDGEHQNADKAFEIESHARWWLDRERAKFVCYSMKALLYFPVDGVVENGNGHNNSTSSAISKLDIVDEYRAQFLLHATAKSLVDAALALDSGSGAEILL